MRLPHELFRLNRLQAVRVLKHVAEGFTLGIRPVQIINLCPFSHDEVRFCGWYTGLLVGMNFQYEDPRTFAEIRANPQAVATILQDTCGIPFRRPSLHDPYSSFIHGFITGVTWQATGYSSIEAQLQFLGRLLDMTDEEGADWLYVIETQHERDRLGDVV